MSIQAKDERDAIRLAWAACFDASNANMRKAGRSKWSRKDRDVGIDAFYAVMSALGYPQPLH